MKALTLGFSKHFNFISTVKILGITFIILGLVIDIKVHDASDSFSVGCGFKYLFFRFDIEDCLSLKLLDVRYMQLHEQRQYHCNVKR